MVRRLTCCYLVVLIRNHPPAGCYLPNIVLTFYCLVIRLFMKLRSSNCAFALSQCHSFVVRCFFDQTYWWNSVEATCIIRLCFYYPPFASIAKGEVFVLLYVCLFVNDFSTTRRPFHAKVRMQAYSGSGCVFSPFGGWRPPAGGKRGKWIFRYYGSQWGIFAFWGFFSDISATLARIHTKYYLCRDNVRRRAPSPCGVHRPLGGRGEGS